MSTAGEVTTARARALLQLVLLPGLGSVRASRLLDAFGGSADRVLGASHAAWCAVPGIGRVTSEKARGGIGSIGGEVEAECALMEKGGVRAVALGDPGYPPLLSELPDAPRLLFIRGELGQASQDATRDAYPVAIVGSRRCTQYGLEQAERFGGVLGRSGLTVVSGGARGIDTAAHRGSLRSGGRTIVVLGCGLGRAYPPENGALFDRIVGEGSGAIVSELPMRTEPRGEHFPARNRIISGLSLGVVVIEAGRKSGALITAAVAAEEHGREVMVLPGRVDSEAVAGSLDLLKRGGGALVTEPGDVLAHLEAPARFAYEGVHAARYADPAVVGRADARDDEAIGSDEPGEEAALMEAIGGASGAAGGVTFDGLCLALSWPASRIRTVLTLLELSGRVRRIGSLFVLSER
jgi:DNA processing protein